MPIDTNFGFHHFQARSQLARSTNLADLLGPLRGLVADLKKRSWVGEGFNLLWRPHFGGAKDFFLQLMFTQETLDFTDITGTGIANRGFKQKDIALGGVAYLQQIKDSFDQSDQHFEPGVWTNVPSTDSPLEAATVARMGSIPHGTTINLQGEATTLVAPDMNNEIPVTFIKPFSIGSDDNGVAGVVPKVFDAEQLLTAQNVSRTDLSRIAKLTQAQLTDPNLILKQANDGLSFGDVVRISVASDLTLVASKPDLGGGTRNIAFLQGRDNSTTNADVLIVSATFWIQKAKEQTGKDVDQIQYAQRVLMNFNGLSWPHVSVGTLRPA